MAQGQCVGYSRTAAAKRRNRRSPPDNNCLHSFDHAVLQGLIDAAGRGDVDQVASLLADGVDPNAVMRQRTALFEAARNDRRETVELLLSEGADPNLENGTSPLWIAAFYGHTDVRVSAMIQLILDFDHR